MKYLCSSAESSIQRVVKEKGELLKSVDAMRQALRKMDELAGIQKKTNQKSKIKFQKGELLESVDAMCQAQRKMDELESFPKTKYFKKR